MSAATARSATRASAILDLDEDELAFRGALGVLTVAAALLTTWVATTPPRVHEAVVDVDGSVTQVRVTRSLDNTFGLDQAAIDAARQWKFEPGTLKGKPVPVLITLLLEFRLKG